MIIPADTVQAMIPFNGTDEITFIVDQCSNVSIGLMNLTSFQQWNTSGLSGTAPFLPGSQTGFQTTELVSFTISSLKPQTQYIAVLQSPSTTDAYISMSLYLGSEASLETIIPVRSACSAVLANSTISQHIQATMHTHACIDMLDVASACNTACKHHVCATHRQHECCGIDMQAKLQLLHDVLPTQCGHSPLPPSPVHKPTTAPKK